MHQAFFILLAAAPALIANVAVLAFASASSALWVLQISASIMAITFAVIGARFINLPRFPVALPAAIMLLTLTSLAAPLFSSISGPTRWLSLGPMNLYIAPVVLPAFLMILFVTINNAKLKWYGIAAGVSASLLLALQPDASQSVALLIGVAVVVVKTRLDRLAAMIIMILVSIATAWSVSQPDPLEPVPHVEEVFVLALEHSMLAGVGVIACAFLFLAGLSAYSFGRIPCLLPVASYYTVLFVFSILGLTPAPLIGYGAGPVLGYGFVVAISSWASLYWSSNNSFNNHVHKS